MTRRAALGVLLAACIATETWAVNPRKAFIDSWRGRHVIVKHTLYTLVYAERGWLGETYHGKREGLTVVTPTDAVFLRFDGRDNEPDATARTPEDLVDRLKSMYYRSKTLDVGAFQRIQPSVVESYEPGVELVVSSVLVEKDRVRIVLANEAAKDKNEKRLATTLTIQWPADLSESFGERPEIERLIGQFVAAPSR